MDSPQESSTPPLQIYDTCCVCNRGFYSDVELADHLVGHGEDPEFKDKLEEFAKQAPRGVIYEYVNESSSSRGKGKTTKRDLAQRSGSPEVLTISDDSGDESPKIKYPLTRFTTATLPTKATILTPLATKDTISTPLTPKATISTPLTTNAQIYNCQPCKKNFNDLKLYKIHLATNHKTILHVCQICNKKFAYKDTLRQHLLMHVGEKTHECKTCHKKFSMKRMLRQHEETHHQPPSAIANSSERK